MAYSAVPSRNYFSIRAFSPLAFVAFSASLPLHAYEIDTTDLPDATVTARAQFTGGGELAINAFDNNSATKWLDDNTNGAVPDGNPANYSFIDFMYSGAQTRACFKYSITSANDAPDRDPADWAVYGIDALGNRTLLDSQTNQVFSTRFEKKTFSFANTTRYRGYRFEIRRIFNPPGNVMQLAEIEYIDSISETTDPQTGTFSARGDNPPNEITSKLFDNSTATKWLDHIVPDGTPAKYTWVQYMYPGTETHAINRYALTSANDVPGRDPRDWVLYGVDAGGGLTQLDARTGQSFPTRFCRQGYGFTNSTPYRGYRLEIRLINDTSLAHTQLAELEFIDDVAARPALSLAAGTYAAPQTLALSTVTAGASIRYTLDGSDPTPTTGTLYAGSFALNAAATVKAIAYKTPLENSAIVSTAFNLVQLPSISAVAPTVGPIAGGHSITLTGTNFVAGQTQVSLGGSLCTSVNVISATSLTCVTPAHAAGTVNLVVTISGVATGTLNNAYRYLQAPTLDAFTPSASLLPGGSAVTLSGTNFPPFTNLISVTLAGIPATVNSVAADGTSITVTASPSATPQSGPIAITVYGSQTITSTTPFVYFSPSTIASFTPPGGPLQGGEPVTITGTNFPAALSAYTVIIAGTPAQVLAVAPGGTSLTVLPGAVPAPVEGPIAITLYGIQTSVSATDYFYDFAPQFSEAPALRPNPTVAGSPVVTVGSLTGVGTLQWSWGDGTPAQTGSNLTHIYAAPGMFTVTVVATAPSGLVTTQSFTVFVGLGIEGSGGGDTGGGGGGANPGGITGIQVGGSGLSKAQGGSGKIICNYVRRDRTTYMGSIGHLKLPADLTQNDLLGQTGTLILGTGSPAQTFVFTLKKNGKGKATGLPLVEFSIAKKYFRFKARREGLVDLTEALGGPRQLGLTKGEPVTLQIPATLQLGEKVFLALTFIVDYQQLNTGLGKGKLK